MTKTITESKYEDNVTRASFIQLLKTPGEEGWSKFYDIYAPLILNIAKKRGCSEALAEDVLQETVVALVRTIPNFDYQREKGKFRTFLYKITESKVIDAFRRNKRHVNVGDDNILDQHAKNNLHLNQSSLRALWDQTWHSNLLSMALDAVKKRVNKLTYQCFEKVYLGGKSVKETAEELKISPNLVSQHKYKVYQLVLEEAENLRNKYGD